MEFVPAVGKGEQGFYCEQQEEEEEEEEHDLELQILSTTSKGMLQSATNQVSAPPSSSHYYNSSNSNKSPRLLQLSSNGGRWGDSAQNYEQMQRSEHHFSFDGSGGVGGEQSDRGGDRGRGFVVEREHMFDKVVTPSDVGKLNRLVIPKQHAEKYFPLDSSNNEKGLLLNFEDRSGKSWRFRYSYWNSSQSYVMTKGWSRFVKDKKLDAGDIVSFHRGIGDFGKDRFYIDWRRRPDPPLHDPSSSASHHFSFHHHHRSSVPWSPLLFRAPPSVAPAGTTTTVAYPRDHMYSSHSHSQQQHNHWMNSTNYHHPYRNHNGYGHGAVVGARGGSDYAYGNMRSTNQYHIRRAQNSEETRRAGGDGAEPMVLESVPVVQGKATGKKLRLFGVNMECSISGGGSELDDCDILESSTRPHATMVSHSPQLSSSSHPHLQLRLYNGTPLHLQQQPNNNDNSHSNFIS